MTGFVIDASVAVKWFMTENGSDAAVRLLLADQPLMAPELIYTEVANALWAAVRRGDMTSDGLREAIDALTAGPVSTSVATKQLIGAAARLAVDLAHPVYDCLYLALALHEQRPVVTADRRFQDVVHRHPYLSDRIRHLENLT